MKCIFINHLLRILIVLMSVTACSTMNRVRTNPLATYRQMNKLCRHNGNAFCIKQDFAYSSVSVVWTYDGERIFLLAVDGCRISKKEASPSKDWTKDVSLSAENIKNEFAEKAHKSQGFLIEDRNVIGFKLQRNEISWEELYVYQFDTLVHTTHVSDFWEHVAHDAQHYALPLLNSVLQESRN